MRLPSKTIKLLLAMLFTFPAIHAQQQVRLTGTITDATSDSVLRNAEVILLKNKYIRHRTTFSSPEGNFEMRVEPGSYTLVVLAQSHKTYSQALTISKDTQIAVRIIPLQYELGEAVVTDSRHVDPVKAPQMGMEKMDGRQIEKIPSILGEPDPVKALQTLPGVQGGGEGSSGFFIRGGSHDQNLFLLDNVHLYQINHLFGLLSVFNADIVDEVTLYKGDFPAQYGGRLSSVMAVETRDGNRDSTAVSAAIGLISSKLTVDGPINNRKGTFLLSGRRSYADLITRSINALNKNKEDYQPIPNYNFHDLNGKLTLDLNEKNKIWFSGYYGDDYLYLRESNGLDYTNKWGNTLLSMGWESRFSKNTRATFTAFNTRYRYTVENATGGYNSRLTSNISDLGMKAHFENSRFSRHKISYGGEYIYHHFLPQEVELSVSDISLFQSTGTGYQGQSAAIYLHDVWKATGRIEMSGGMRLSSYLYGSTTYFNPEPRISASLGLSERVYLKAAYARMSQYSHLISNSRISFPTDIWYPATEEIPFQRSDQVSAGVHSRLGKQWQFVYEAYYKKMDDVVEYAPGTDILYQPDLEGNMVSGQGWSYGNEFLLRKSGGRLTGSLAYTLSWAEQQFDAKNHGRTFYANYDRRHVINLVGSYALNERTDFGLHWEFASGNPGTVPVGRYPIYFAILRTGDLGPEYREINNVRLPAFHHLDISYKKQLKSSKAEKYLIINIYNVYYRRNTFFVQRVGVKDEHGAYVDFLFESVSLLPIIPNVTYQINF